ncbi:MAG: HAMP domain-containing histidine kinase [Kaiparowitsia implicata GSE-PSE-MK54-09C]|jgi:OmpR-family two-component system manganese-sensing sensor histidine kinase|nr:HAMP domain-containing histidine kinase [Kaiparowitsia implicata GSE-PSE-MK54-09C]
MFQVTRQRLALWYTMVTAVLLLLFASGFYWYVRSTLIERIDDTLNHVVEVVSRSLVVEPANLGGMAEPSLQLNIDASFRDDVETVEDDHIDLEWFDAAGSLVWSTFSAPLLVPLHANPEGETVRLAGEQLLRQVTRQIEHHHVLLGYLRVSHPWFEVTKPTRQLIRDLALGTGLTVAVVGLMGWLLSGLAIAPVRESYQRLKQFTADASHELRNPIAVIQTNVQVALADPNPDVVLQQQQLQVIERLTRRLGRLVDDLLFLARQDSSMTRPRQDMVALDGLLQEVVEEQQAIAADKSIPIALTVVDAAQLGAVAGDRDQLMRLFTNLISNAVQYTPSGGAITVTLQAAKAHSGQLQVSIQDTGVGIASDALPYVFDRFYRVDPARSHASGSGDRTPPTPGSGLGLAIAKTIAERHQGEIHLESRPDQGTTVTLFLPVHNSRQHGA